MNEPKCKWLSDDFLEVCTNADCPVCADFCPVTNYTEICKFAAIGKKPGDKMDDVRRVTGHTEAFTNRDGEVERITIHDNEPDAIVFQKNESGGYIVKTVRHATSDKSGKGDLVTVLSENAMIESIAYMEAST